MHLYFWCVELSGSIKNSKFNNSKFNGVTKRKKPIETPEEYVEWRLQLESDVRKKFPWAETVFILSLSKLT